MSGRAPEICLFGASRDTGNLGVSALMTSTVLGIAARRPDARVTVFDHGLGQRKGRISREGDDVEYDLLGARVGRRYHLPENLLTMQLSARLGGLGNVGARAVARADAVLDVSGGDSFTDLYGRHGLELITRPKRLAIQSGTPLVLLPQTYGPFTSQKSLDACRMILLRSSLAFARGSDSYRIMQELLGADFDAIRHRQGVDLALALPPAQPPETVTTWLTQVRGARSGSPLIGLNVSGLLFDDDDSSSYGLKTDYRSAVTAFARRLLAESDATLVLVPHVVGDGESDMMACERLAGILADRERVVVAPERLDSQQTKWLIGEMDWFCGTRMHSTIAALSSGVPVAAVAYSHKTREVFDSCGLSDEVADARTLDTRALVDQLWRSWSDRHEVRRALQAGLPAALEQADKQLDLIMASVDGAKRLPARAAERAG